MSFLRKNWIVFLVGGSLAVTVFLVGQYYGRRGARPIEWYSQAAGVYVIDQEIKCPGPGGKSLGWVKVDLNLTNGKLRVVRNDPGKWPSCK